MAWGLVARPAWGEDAPSRISVSTLSPLAIRRRAALASRLSLTSARPPLSTLPPSHSPPAGLLPSVPWGAGGFLSCSSRSAISLAAICFVREPRGFHVSALFMSLNMEQAMTAKPSISAKGSAMSAALELVRPMLVAIGGSRGWDDTKDHWRNKLARKVGINARRVRAILSKNEDVRLTADEYLAIEERFRALDHRLAEDLRALSSEVGAAPAGEVRAGGATHPRARGGGAGNAPSSLRADGR